MSTLTAPPPVRRRGSPISLIWLVLILGFIGVVFFARQTGETVKVLFVGNSYTFYNELPTMVTELAGSGGARISASTIAIGGAWLADHVRNPEVSTALNAGEFDVVVLQEQSMAPADPQVARDSTYPAAARLAGMAASAGTRIVFFQTWGHRGGNRQVGHGTYESMQDALTSTYADLAVRYAGEIAPAGEAWRTHLLSGSRVPLHDHDGSHPTPSGSYLAAATIAATITDLAPSEFTWSGPIDETTARMLLESAQAAMATAR